jgi:hypothetical protein
MWVLNFLPDWIFHAILIFGIFGFMSTFLLKVIPFFRMYELPIQIFSILVIAIGVWFEGAMSNQAEWETKVLEMEMKAATAEVKSAETNVEIVTQFVEKTKVVREKGKTIIDYVDREVVKDKEVIKFVENCPIPIIIIDAHNAGAMNKPVEIKEPEKKEQVIVPETKVEAPVKNTEPEKIMAKVLAWSNIRPNKDTTSEKIEKLSPGYMVEVIKIDENYVFVKGKKEGWVGKEFISIEKKG